MNLSPLPRLLLLAAIASGLPACMPSGGVSSTTTTTTSSISGIVADGYISGARVFLDKNGNGVLDTAEGEPFSELSSAAGAFEIKGISASDLERYNLVASVPATAKDADYDGTVDKPFYLVYPKGGPGKPVISPLSTLISARVNQQGLSIDAATADIVARLGLPIPAGVTNDQLKNILTIDMLKEATQPGTDNYPLALTLNRFSRVMNNAVGRALDQAKTNMGTSITTADEFKLFNLVVNNSLDALPAIAGSASTLKPEAAYAATSTPTTGTTPTTPTSSKALMQADVVAKGTALAPTLLGANLTNQNMIIAQVTQGLAPAATQKSVKVLLETGVYGLRGRTGAQAEIVMMQAVANAPVAPPTPPSSGDGPVVAPQPITSTSATGTARNSYLTGATIPVMPATLLSKSNLAVWTPISFPLDFPFPDGATLALSDSGNDVTSAGLTAKLYARTFDLAGKSMDYILLRNGLTSANGFSPTQRSGDVTFPSGSEAYVLTAISQDDIYSLSSLETAGASIDEFLTNFSTLGPNRFSASELQMQFAPGSTVGATSGAVRFFDSQGVAINTYGDGIWRRETVRGKEILRLATVADVLKLGAMGLTPEQELFVTRNDGGKMAIGVKTTARVSQSMLVFNKTAINAIDDLPIVP